MGLYSQLIEGLYRGSWVICLYIYRIFQRVLIGVLLGVARVLYRVFARGC